MSFFYPDLSFPGKQEKPYFIPSQDPGCVRRATYSPENRSLLYSFLSFVDHLPVPSTTALIDEN